MGGRTAGWEAGGREGGEGGLALGTSPAGHRERLPARAEGRKTMKLSCTPHHGREGTSLPDRGDTQTLSPKCERSSTARRRTRITQVTP